MIRAEPNIPASKIKPQSHQIGLNWKMKLYESNPPIIIPQLVCGADFPFQVDTGTDNHTKQSSYDYSAHIAWKMNPVHGQKTSCITHDRNQVWQKAFLSLPQLP